MSENQQENGQPEEVAADQNSQPEETKAEENPAEEETKENPKTKKGRAKKQDTSPSSMGLDEVNGKIEEIESQDFASMSYKEEQKYTEELRAFKARKAELLASEVLGQK